MNFCLNLNVYCLASDKEKVEYFLKHFMIWSGFFFRTTYNKKSNYASQVDSISLYYGYNADRTSVTEKAIYISKEKKLNTAMNLKKIATEIQESKIYLSEDIIEFVEIMLSYHEEYNSVSYGNFLSEKIFKENPVTYSYPFVNLIFKLLQEKILNLIGADFYILGHNPHFKNSKFSIVLTHDIDYLKRSFLNRLKTFRNFIVSLKKVKIDSKTSKFFFNILETLVFSFSIRRYNLCELRKIEEKLSCRSSLNFCAYQPDKDDTLLDKILNPLYNSKKINIESILDTHFEMGMHGSTKAATDKVRFSEEIEILRKKESCLGGRQHMLSFKFPETFYFMEACGYKYDSSMGFNDFNGFRGSNAILHYPKDLKKDYSFSFYEIPLLFMDSVFLKQGVVNNDIIIQEASDFAKNANELSYVGSICWHDMAFFKNSTLASAYKKVLKLWSSLGGALLSPGEFLVFHEAIKKISINLKNQIMIPEAIPGGLYIFAYNKESKILLTKICEPATYNIHGAEQ